MTEEKALIEPNPSVPFFSGVKVFTSTIYHNSYLIRNLARRDIKNKYSKAFIGFGWTFLEPLLLSIVYYALFTIIAGRPRAVVCIACNYRSNCLEPFGKSLPASVAGLTKKNLIKQVYFPREILVVSPVIAQFWISCTSLLAVIPIMYYLDVEPTFQILWMLPFRYDFFNNDCSWHRYACCAAKCNFPRRSTFV